MSTISKVLKVSDLLVRQLPAESEQWTTDKGRDWQLFAFELNTTLLHHINQIVTLVDKALDFDQVLNTVMLATSKRKCFLIPSFESACGSSYSDVGAVYDLE
jgi:hypothetical protein